MQGIYYVSSEKTLFKKLYGTVSCTDIELWTIIIVLHNIIYDVILIDMSLMIDIKFWSEHVKVKKSICLNQTYVESKNVI